MLKINGLYLPMLANRIVTGDVFFLDSGATNTNDDPGNGKDPRKPFSTLDYAQSKMADNNDDLLVIAANHSETVTGAGGITLDKPGTSIVGQGRYDARPTFLMDGSAITGLITAPNVSIENVKFLAGHSDIAVGFLVTAKGFKMQSCHFEGNTTDENFVNCVTAGAADNDYDGMELINNVMEYGVDDGALNPINLLKNSRDVRIMGNKILADLDTTPYAAIYSVNTEVHINIEIGYNMIHNLHNANAVVGISAGSTDSTGWMHHNIVYALDTNGGTPFVSAATGIAMWDNKYAHAANISAYQMPTLGTYAA
jgi:hypothetical protein